MGDLTTIFTTGVKENPMDRPMNRRRFLQTTLAGSLAGGLASNLVIPGSGYSQDGTDNLPDISTSDYRAVGDPEGKTLKMLGYEIINTKFFIAGDLTQLPSRLKKHEFYKAIEPLEKAIRVNLLYESASKDTIVKGFTKFSNKAKVLASGVARRLKRPKGFYTLQDTNNIHRFLENANLNQEYFSGTKFILETGNKNKNPRLRIYDSDGDRITNHKEQDPEILNSLGKFLTFQLHWFSNYRRLRFAK